MNTQFNQGNSREERPAIQEENVLVPEPSSVAEFVQSEMPLTNENEQQGRSNTGDLNANVNELSSQNISTLRTVPLISLSVSSKEDQQKMGIPCYSDVSSSANLSRFSRGSSENAKRKQVLRKRLRSGKTLNSKSQSLKGNTSTKSSNKAKSHYLAESKVKPLIYVGISQRIPDKTKRKPKIVRDDDFVVPEMPSSSELKPEEEIPASKSHKEKKEVTDNSVNPDEDPGGTKTG
ncbi:hypothetical protein Anas_14607 [Armadillidium nasatum]|uniref:Uncharacterized protein n=1 Tax=Armadillidium nasatum TaxID=96803 RepID=A0A5N5TED4_9CRUS|nr:hypothetical protein Anas_14607 [Armadillidium nasatum]